MQASRDQDTRELLHVGLSLSNPRDRLVFSRPINPAFAVAEVIWILAGRDDLAFLRPWNPRMAQYSDDQDRLHGAYGLRLRSHFGFDQLRAATSALSSTPHSRQVVLQIWDARSDMPSPAPRSKDIPCNLLSHLTVRDGKLEWLQVMRSTDLIWGLPYNLIQFTCLQEILAGWLGIDVGNYIHVSDSLHVYKRHWELLERPLAPTAQMPLNTADLRLPADEFDRLMPRLESSTMELANSTHEEDIVGLGLAFDGPRAYREWVALLALERLRRLSLPTSAPLAKAIGPYLLASWREWSRAAPPLTAGRTPQ